MTSPPYRGFDVDVCKETVGDARTREIEGKARTDADRGTSAFDPPAPPNEDATYWVKAKASMDFVVYFNAFKKRIDRAMRMAAKPEFPEFNQR